MAKRGENIYKRQDGRWEGRYIREYTAQGKARFGYVYAKTYREAKKKLLEASRNVTISRKVARINLGDYIDEWLRMKRDCVKPSTLVKYTTILNKHIRPVWSDTLPTQLTTASVEQFGHGLLVEQGLSPKTVKDILMVFKAIVAYVHTEAGEGLPLIRVVYPREQKKELRVLTPQEQQRFANYLTDTHDTVKFGVFLALFTGLRIGELCALRWGDIDMKSRLLYVSRTMQRLACSTSEAQTQIVTGDAKSAAANRVIPMIGDLVTLCETYWCDDPEAYVLTGTSSRYMEPRTLQYRLEKYTAECGLKDVHFHTLRHTFATRCVEAGFELKSLSEILGHSSAKVTLDRYVHSSLELKRENMNKLAVGI